MTDSPSAPPEDTGRPQNLGSTLRTARERKGLELSDVAEATHVRREYLLALEEGRYADLPEDVYSRNFLRLYAQAVGLESGKLLEMYTRERSGARVPVSAPSAGEPHDRSPRQATSPAGRPRPVAQRPAPETHHAHGPAEPQYRALSGQASGSRSLALPAMRIGSMVATVLLVAAIVAVALWAFNNRLFNASRGAVLPPAAADSNDLAVPPDGASISPIAPGADGTPSATEQARDVLLTVDSEPTGAEVTVDGFPLPGTTPIQNVPVTARASRLVRVTLDGYEPFEATYDLSFDRTLTVNLVPVAAPAAPAAPIADAAATADGPPPTAGQGQIALNVTEATWLEVYAGTARQQGERLVYTTAQPGDRFMFELPVYVHVGNAAGLHVSVNGQDLGAFGSSGAVTGRAFTQ